MNAYLQADTRDRTIGHWSELVAAVPEEEPHHRHRSFGAIRLSRGTGYRPPVPSASGEAAPGQVRAVEGFAPNDALASPDDAHLVIKEIS